MTFKNVTMAFCFLLLFSGVCSGQDIPIKDPAAWVVKASETYPSEIPEGEVSNGVYNALVDMQIRVQKNGEVSRYYHYEKVVVNSSGLSQASQINIDYDPIYQQFELHSLSIFRDGEEVSRLDNAEFSEIQREEDLEKLIYNGTKTVNIIINDVRINDVISYNFTVHGDNPVHKGKFAQNVATQWRVPVGRLVVSLIWEKENPLYVKEFNTISSFSTSKNSSGTLYRYEQEKVPALSWESGAPSWYDPFPHFYFTEFSSWQEVVDWALIFYGRGELPQELKGKLGNQVIAGLSPKEIVAVSLRYVQNNIRYLGIEMGESSHAPSKPIETFLRRFGDCKDKSILLVSLLNEHGINAWPAFVSSDLKGHISDYPPTHRIFDHVIVAAEIEGKTYWIDPTRDYQYGSLDEIYQKNYGKALVIRPGESGLTKVEVQDEVSKTVLKEVFDLTEGEGKTARYTVETKSYGYKADELRSWVSRERKSVIEGEYLHFYQGYYPSTIQHKEAVFEFSETVGETLTRESYDIPDFWYEGDKEGRIEADFYANAISDYLKNPKVINRSTPLSLPFPVSIEQEIEVRLSSEGWDLESDKFLEDNEYFSFSYESVFDKSKNIYTLNYRFQTKSDYVPPEGMAGYVEALGRSRENDSYGVYFNTDSSSDAVEESGLELIFYIIFVSLALVVVIVVDSLLDKDRRGRARMADLYQVSPLKFIVLSFVTLGVYDAYWFYRNWRYIKKNQDLDIMPFWRALFSPLWFYSFCEKLKVSCEVEKSWLFRYKWVSIALAISYLSFNAIQWWDSVAMLSFLITPLCVLPLVLYVKSFSKPEETGIQPFWRIRHFALVVLGFPLMTLVFGSELYLLPHERVIPGDKLWKHDLKFLRRQGIVEPNEKIILFYSDAFLNLRADGNGFTDNSVFSYWDDKQTGFNYESLAFADIKNIELTESGEWDESSTVKVYSRDGGELLLFVSNVKGDDKFFYESLTSAWKIKQKDTGT